MCCGCCFCPSRWGQRRICQLHWKCFFPIFWLRCTLSLQILNIKQKDSAQIQCLLPCESLIFCYSVAKSTRREFLLRVQLLFPLKNQGMTAKILEIRQQI